MDDYLDSPMDADDIFPCKGCGEVGRLLHHLLKNSVPVVNSNRSAVSQILEEGKAFELGTPVFVQEDS